jgi:hypothetical protein
MAGTEGTATAVATSRERERFRKILCILIMAIF